MRILIVDDDDISLEMLENVLTRSGHEVVMAANGEEAWRLIVEQDLRLVISDWNMPGMDGPTLCEKVRRAQLPWYVYFILLTARNSTDDLVEGLSAGADDFIPKPFEPAELKVRIKAGERILAMETRHVAIFAMAKLAESRDPETGQHLERMREYARVIAQHLAAEEPLRSELPHDFVELIYLTSPLHDVGKVGIPDCVLLKAGRLTDSEFQVMQSHTTIGGDTLGAAAHQYPSISYLQMARDIALCHHERWDGSGYPARLQGEAIPLPARIVALADVYDALTSKRVYKAAFTHDIARNILVEGRDKHFDPRVVDAFLAHEDEFIAIHNRLSGAA